MSIEIPNTDMVEYYLKRTRKHIDRVIKNCYIISKHLPEDIKNILNDRVELHDVSKFSEDEFYPYVWLTWIKKPGNENFVYNHQINEYINKAWEHHKRENKHHPEYFEIMFGDINKMTIIDLAEMVADWHSMTQEFGGSTKEWMDKNVGSRWKFNDVNKREIEKYVKILEK